jgi:nucleoside-diphosphate-sugar epimerase
LVTGIKDSYHQLINPAVQGVKNVINSVNITPSVHRLILTSSIAAVYGDHSEIKNTNSALFDESCWNKTSTPRHRPYSYSKTIAEKQAWSMVREQNRWDLVVLNPGRVFGPSLSSRTDNVSVKTMLQFGNGCFKRGLPQIFTPLVDVRDVAKAHINAAFNSAANGRYILVSQVLPLLKIAAMLRENFSNQYPFPRQRLYKLIFWLGAPLLGYSRRYVSNNVNIPIRVDNSRSKQDLALDYIKVERTITDHFQQLINDNLLKVVN